MQITISQDCSSVEISSDLLTTFVGTVQLTITDMVSKAEAVVDILVTDLVNNNYTYTTNSEGGIFEYKLTQDDNGSLLIDKTCVFLDCDILCDSVTTDIETNMLHYSLKLSERCGCDCQNMEPIYELLLQKIDEKDSNCKEC